MKYIVFGLLIAVVLACKTEKKMTDQKVVEEAQPSEPLRIVGTIHLEKDGCPILLNANDNGVEKVFYPVNLEDKLKIEGMKIRFFYELSRAKQPTGCKIDKVVSLYDVTPLR